MGCVSLKEKLRGVLGGLPDKTRVFFTAMWFWAYVIHMFTKCFNLVLRIVLTYTPNSMLVYNPMVCVKKRQYSDEIHPEIIEARSDKCDITNKIKAVLDFKWDADINNEGKEEQKLFGGLNVKDIVDSCPSLTSSVMWIAYVFAEKKLSDMTSEEIGENIKQMLIDFNDKTIYRKPEMTDKKKVVVGEVPF